MEIIRNRVVQAAADQAVSTVGNTAFAVVVAYGATDSAEYGLFTLVYMSVFFANSFYLAATVEPVSTAEIDAEDVLARVLSAQWILWLAYFGIAVALAAVFGSPHLTLVCALSAALASSGYIIRAYYIAAGLPMSAIALDMSWLFMQVIGFLILWSARNQSVAALSLVWGASGFSSAVLSLIVKKTRCVSVCQLPLWNWRYGREFVLNNAPPILLIYILGMFAGAAAVGAVRLVLVMLGPINTIMLAARYAIVPHLSRRRVQEPYTTYLVLQVGYCSVAAACAAIVWFAFPFFRSSLNWDAPPTTAVFILLAVGKVCFASVYASLTFLRSVRSTDTATLSTLAAIITIGIGSVGAIFFDVFGFALGSAVSACIAAVVWIRGSVQAIRSGLGESVRSAR